MKLKLIIGIVGILSACGFTNAPSLDTNQEKQDNNWVIGPFLRPEGVNPVISPQPTVRCVSSKLSGRKVTLLTLLLL